MNAASAELRSPVGSSILSTVRAPLPLLLSGRAPRCAPYDYAARARALHANRLHI